MIKLSDFYITKTTREQKGEVIPYGVRMVGAPLEWPETKGKGIKVGIIDTGIDQNHVDLKERIRKYKDFSGEGLRDDNGHGTHVAGTIAASLNNVGVVGVVPEADLYVAKAFKKNGETAESSVIDAILWLLSENVDVVNMSFSSTNTSSRYYDAIKKLYQAGVAMVAAAGNEGEKGIGYPALYPETICVSAVNTNKITPSFSSVGTTIDVCAAGVDIYSAYPGNSYAILSGTSMATPIITGSVALLQGKAMIRYNRKLTLKEIRLLLQMYAEGIGSFGRDKHYGYGLFSFARIFKPEKIHR